MTIQQTNPNQLVDLKTIRQLSGVSHDYIYKQIKQGQIPAPIKFGRASRWRLVDVEAWINSKSQGGKDE